MSVGRIIDAEGNVAEVEHVSPWRVVEAMLEADQRRADAYDRDIAAWDANQRSTLFSA